MTFQQNNADTPSVQFLLDSVRLRVSGEVGFAYRLSSDKESLTLLAGYANDPALLSQLSDYIVGLHQQGISPEDWMVQLVSDAGFTGGILDSQHVDDQILALGVLSLNGATYSEDDHDTISQALSLMSSEFRTQQLQRNLEQERTLNELRRVSTEAANAQEIVDALRTYVLSDHIGACALLSYGPALVRDIELLEYVEISGLWVRDVGGGYGIGTRVYLEAHETILEALDENGVLISNEDIEARLAQDALLSGLIKSRLVQQWALIALHTPEQRVGLWLITSNRPDGFTDDEIALYQQVGDLLTQCLMLKNLQRDRANNAHGRTALLEAVNDGILLTTPGTHGVVVARMNQRFCDLFDYRGKQQYVSLNSVVERMQIPPSIRQKLRASWKSLPFRGSETLEGDFEMVSHQGQPQHIQWYSSPIYDPDDGTVFSRVFIFHDATPERAALQVRSAFLSRVSHELRTPLTSISGFAQFILESEADDLPDTAREYVEIIHESAGRLKHIFSRLIDITRAYAGEVALDLQPCDLERTVRSVVHIHAEMDTRSQQNLTLTLDHESSTVLADPKRLGQILSHLVENAILFTPPGGDITISTCTIRTVEDLPDHAPRDLLLPAVLFGIEDTGPGIIPEEAEAVFEPFHRTRVAMSRQIEGAGLGLTLAQTLVDLHRGKIWVHPVVGEEIGGRLYFTLPITGD